jgi:L-lactate dehydrogenase complex protein LldG
MERLDVAILAGVLGVAENGAVWVDGANLESRVLPFICQHLVLVLSERGLVPTMHDAYGAIRMGDSDYGVFIAGPSKTADIEQSLVIGAHGPRSLTLFLTP